MTFHEIPCGSPSSMSYTYRKESSLCPRGERTKIASKIAKVSKFTVCAKLTRQDSRSQITREKELKLNGCRTRDQKAWMYTYILLVRNSSRRVRSTHRFRAILSVHGLRTHTCASTHIHTLKHKHLHTYTRTLRKSI